MKKFFVAIILLLSLVACEDKNIQDKDKIKIENIKSKADFDGDGIDDYTEFVEGARKDAKNHPRYNPAYVSEDNGYPDKFNGVCTDVIWRAFKEAGYSLRNMLNKDIEKNREWYEGTLDNSDENIDFRRVINLRPFFEKYAITLEKKLENPKEWQPGDIVIFNPDDFHIGILSDKRDENGFPLVFHNMGQINREEKYLKEYNVSGHFRFDATKVPDEVLIKWQDGEDGNKN